MSSELPDVPKNVVFQVFGVVQEMNNGKWVVYVDTIRASKEHTWEAFNQLPEEDRIKGLSLVKKLNITIA